MLCLSLGFCYVQRQTSGRMMSHDEVSDVFQSPRLFPSTENTANVSCSLRFVFCY